MVYLPTFQMHVHNKLMLLTNFKHKITSFSGLYLYMLVVETFSGDNLKFAMYALIGWGKLMFGF